MMIARKIIKNNNKCLVHPILLSVDYKNKGRIISNYPENKISSSIKVSNIQNLNIGDNLYTEYKKFTIKDIRALENVVVLDQSINITKPQDWYHHKYADHINEEIIFGNIIGNISPEIGSQVLVIDNSILYKTHGQIYEVTNDKPKKVQKFTELDIPYMNGIVLDITIKECMISKNKESKWILYKDDDNN